MFWNWNTNSWPEGPGAIRRRYSLWNTEASNQTRPRVPVTPTSPVQARSPLRPGFGTTRKPNWVVFTNCSMALGAR